MMRQVWNHSTEPGASTERTAAQRERTGGLWRVLVSPGIYMRLQASLAVRGGRAEVADRYIRATAGDRILDIGCGPADILEYLPAVRYVGVDLNPDYLRAAARRFRSSQPGARFVRMDVRSIARSAAGRFDLVLAAGLLHHFDDTEAVGLLATVRALLRPGGRLITVDPGFAAGQGPLARLLIANDRGRHVRPVEAYGTLARQVFEHVQLHVRHDLMRLPYTHAILECSAMPSARA